MGNGKAEGLSAIGDGGKAMISFIPNVDCTGSGSLLETLLSTLLKKQSSNVWVVTLLFLS